MNTIFGMNRIYNGYTIYYFYQIHYIMIYVYYLYLSKMQIILLKSINDYNEYNVYRQLIWINLHFNMYSLEFITRPSSDIKSFVITPS